MAIQSNTARSEAFNRALDAYASSLAAFNFSPSDISVDEERRLESAWTAADHMVMATPVGSISDLRAKAELLFQDPMADPPKETILYFLRDLISLTDHEPSRVFCAKTWVRWFERHGGMWHVNGGCVKLLNLDDDKFKDHRHTLTGCNGFEQVADYIRANDTGLAEAA